MNDYDVNEGFVFDYNKGNWFKTGGEQIEKSSYSKVLKLDLADFLKS
jgi:hypothetical protein